MNGLGFLRESANKVQQVGALWPVSDSVVHHMLDQANVGPHMSTIVEFGMGTGNFAAQILSRVDSSKTRYIGFDINPKFVDATRQAIGDEADNVHLILDSAENLLVHLEQLGIKEVDVVIASLPWSLMPSEVQVRVLYAASQALKPTGMFANVGYAMSRWTKSGKAFQGFMQNHFASVQRGPILWNNLPAAVVTQCTKPKK